VNSGALAHQALAMAFQTFEYKVSPDACAANGIFFVSQTMDQR
jgi:hypothetical protein